MSTLDPDASSWKIPASMPSIANALACSNYDYEIRLH